MAASVKPKSRKWKLCFFKNKSGTKTIHNLKYNTNTIFNLSTIYSVPTAPLHSFAVESSYLSPSWPLAESLCYPRCQLCLTRTYAFRQVVQGWCNFLESHCHNQRVCHQFCIRILSLRWKSKRKLPWDSSFWVGRYLLRTHSEQEYLNEKRDM